MFRLNFLICIAILIGSTGNLFSFQNDKIIDPIAIAVTQAANEDKISNNDLAIWYSVYKSSYLYGTKFDFDGSKDFGVIFDKQRKVRDVLIPDKTVKLKIVVGDIFKKYEDNTLNFDDNSKSKFLEECNSVSIGLKNAID